MYTFKKIAVTSRQLCAVDLPQQIRRLASAGALRPDMVIVREKDLPEEEYEILAGQVMAVCREQQMGCVLHSYPGAARRLGCPAIHMPFAYFREQWESLALCGGCAVGAGAWGNLRDGGSYLSNGLQAGAGCQGDAVSGKGLPGRLHSRIRHRRHQPSAHG